MCACVCVRACAFASCDIIWYRMRIDAYAIALSQVFNYSKYNVWPQETSNVCKFATPRSIWNAAGLAKLGRSMVFVQVSSAIAGSDFAGQDEEKPFKEDWLVQERTKLHQVQSDFADF